MLLLSYYAVICNEEEGEDALSMCIIYAVAMCMGLFYVNVKHKDERNYFH